MSRYREFALEHFRQMLVLVLVLIGTATTAEADGSDTSVIHACVNDITGVTRIVGADSPCFAGAAEHAVHWSIAGPQGPQGAQGPQGPQGPQGAQGAEGPPGPSTDVFHASVLEVALPEQGGQFLTVSHLDLPAGEYVILAKAWFVNLDSVTKGLAYCLLAAPDGSNDQSLTVVEPDRELNLAEALSLNLNYENTQPFRVNLSCTNNNGLGGRLTAKNIVLTAIRVGSLTFQGE